MSPLKSRVVKFDSNKWDKAKKIVYNFVLPTNKSEARSPKQTVSEVTGKLL